MKRIFTYWILMLISISVASAYLADGHISLLTVAESANATIEKGGVADLYLTIASGTGRIFIDSFPLSKVDTQITMRFATELACDFLEKDCTGYDFFYTIKANSAIVGGPSAGAASTVLAVSMLDDQQTNQKAVMTGTINSGYLIGPVAGISAKTLAAQQYGFEKVLIPRWDIANDTPSENLTIKVVPISKLEDALYEFTGKNYTKASKPLNGSKAYTDTMKQITAELCSKYGSIDNGTILMPNLSMIMNDSRYLASNESYNESFNGTINQTDKPKDFFMLAIEAINQGEYYSAASFCFSGNLRITAYQMRNYSINALKKDYAQLMADIANFDNELENRKSFKTISDLETYMIVKERISESQDLMRHMNVKNISTEDLAYAEERFSTAITWSRFFNLQGKEFVLDNDPLKTVCSKKLSETEERINYLELYFPKSVDRTDLEKAYDYFSSEEYALCIFTASKAKADVDVIISALFINEENIKQLLNEKLDAAARAIAEQEDKDVFPILGYSYYEYAKSLQRNEEYSALIYAEYALELSNLEMYFPKKASNDPITILSRDNHLAIFFFGMGSGAFIILLVLLITLFIWGRRHKRMPLKPENPKRKR